MPLLTKAAISLAVILACAHLGKKLPALGGLIATMPITTLLVMLWLRADAPGDRSLLIRYTSGVVWGIVPTALFFLSLRFCLQKGMGFASSLGASGLVWVAGAVAHQRFLH